MIGLVGRPSSPIGQAIFELRPKNCEYLEATQGTFQVPYHGLVWLAYDGTDATSVDLMERMLATRHEHPLKEEGGCVVLNSGFVGRNWVSKLSDMSYAPRMAAQRQMILNLSGDLGRADKFIVGLAPSFVNSSPDKAMNKNIDYRRKIQSRMTVSPFMSPTDVAEQVWHFLQYGKYFNGQTIEMLGGWGL